MVFGVGWVFLGWFLVSLMGNLYLVWMTYVLYTLGFVFYKGPFHLFLYTAPLPHYLPDSLLPAV